MFGVLGKHALPAYVSAFVAKAGIGLGMAHHFAVLRSERAQHFARPREQIVVRQQTWAPSPLWNLHRPGFDSPRSTPRRP